MTDRPPTPSPGERARTIAARGPATLLPPLPTLPPAGAVQPDRVAPLLHHVHDDGVVSVLLPDDHELPASIDALDGELTSMVEVVDVAPVPLRESVRGLLWITGRLSSLPLPAAREVALEIATVRPDPRLLDLGHGATMLRLTPVSMVIADADGTHPVTPATFAACAPDPFCHQEAGWLRHLEVSHTEVVHTLRRHLPTHLQRRAPAAAGPGPVRPAAARRGHRGRPRHPARVLAADRDARRAVGGAAPDGRLPVPGAAARAPRRTSGSSAPRVEAERVDRQADRACDRHHREERRRRHAAVLDLAQGLHGDPGLRRRPRRSCGRRGPRAGVSPRRTPRSRSC